MSAPTNNPAITLRAGTAIVPNRLCSINPTGRVADLCAVNGIPIGQSMDTVEAGELQGIRLPQAGTLLLCAAGAIAVGAQVSTAASGKVNDVAASTSRPFGVALTAAAADGDLIEVLPLVHQGAAAA
jgi:hypothetical protein